MQAKPTAVITGGLIEASHLNNLVDYYNEFWNDPITGGFSFDADHSSELDDRRYGWGQSNATITPTPQGPPNATIVTILSVVALPPEGTSVGPNIPTTVLYALKAPMNDVIVIYAIIGESSGTVILLNTLLFGVASILAAS